jgi:hypothetical protein
MFKVDINAFNSCVDTVSGRVWLKSLKPTLIQAFLFNRTYTSDSGRLPTAKKKKEEEKKKRSKQKEKNIQL